MLFRRQMRPTLSAIARAAINRTNAPNSTGTKTEAGKHRSALNALSHGLTGQIIVLPSDDGFVFSDDEFHAYIHRNTARKRPNTPETMPRKERTDHSFPNPQITPSPKMRRQWTERSVLFFRSVGSSLRAPSSTTGSCILPSCRVQMLPDSFTILMAGR